MGLVYLVSDFTAVIAACYGALWLWCPGALHVPRTTVGADASGFGLHHALLHPIHPSTDIGNAAGVVVLALAVCSLYALLGLYAGRRSILTRRGMGTILAANLLALLLLLGVVSTTRSSEQTWATYGAILQLNVLLAVSFRAAVQGGLRKLADRWGVGECRSILIGDGHRAQALAEIIARRRPHGLRIAHWMEAGPDLIESLKRAVRDNDADMILCADEDLPIGTIMQVLDAAAELGVPTKVLSPTMRVLATRARQPIDEVLGCPLAHFEASAPLSIGLGLRRALFLVGAVLGLLLLLPVMLLIAALIRLTSRGPILFAQERAGIDGKPFRMLKFRTMYEGAELAQADLESQNEADGALFKISDDPRITPFGRLLRKTSLDELPQLINVIRGEMEVIGPRPLPTRDYHRYDERWQYGRHAGPQGLTCLWQVSGRCDLDFQEMCILDVYYLRNQNPVLDLQILLRTLFVVVDAKGAC